MRTIKTVQETSGRGRPAMNVLRLAANAADGETVTIGNDVFEIDSNATFTAGRIQVAVPGLTPTQVTPVLVAAINNNSTHKVLAIQISVNEVLVVSREDGAAGALACSETLAGANNAWAYATMVAGTSPGGYVQMLESRAATAQDVALAAMRFYFPFTVAQVLVQFRTAAGAIKACTGAATMTGKRVDVDNAGGTPWAATDVITVLAST